MTPEETLATDSEAAEETSPVTATTAIAPQAPSGEAVHTKQTVAKHASPKKPKISEEKPVDKVVPYAVIRTGGKQYRVKAGDTIRIEKLDVLEGPVSFTDVLLAGGSEGDAYVKGKDVSAAKVEVTGKIVRMMRAKKVIIFKKRLKGGYTKKQGHRQSQCEVLIEKVAIG